MIPIPFLAKLLNRFYLLCLGRLNYIYSHRRSGLHPQLWRLQSSEIISTYLGNILKRRFLQKKTTSSRSFRSLCYFNFPTNIAVTQLTSVVAVFLPHDSELAVSREWDFRSKTAVTSRHCSRTFRFTALVKSGRSRARPRHESSRNGPNPERTAGLQLGGGAGGGFLGGHQWRPTNTRDD